MKNWAKIKIPKVTRKVQLHFQMLPAYIKKEKNAS